MSDARSPRRLIGHVRERMRANLGEKVTGAVVALVLEALLLLLMLLSLSQMRAVHKDVPMTTVAFDARDYSETPTQPEPKPPTKSARATPPAAQVQPAPQIAQVTPPQPPAAIIPVSPQEMRSFDISNLPKQNTPARPVVGPAYTPAFGDSKRVGTAPNGSPMYAGSTGLAAHCEFWPLQQVMAVYERQDDRDPIT